MGECDNRYEPDASCSNKSWAWKRIYVGGALESMRLFPELDHTDVLELPDGFESLIALAVGYPEKEIGDNQKKHTPISVNFIK